MSVWATIRDMAIRAWRLMSPRYTGEVQSWREYTRALEASGWRPSTELEIRRRLARRRMAKERVEAKFGGGE